MTTLAHRLTRLADSATTVLAAALVIALLACWMALPGCSAAQKSTEETVATCTGQEALIVYGILEGSGSKQDKAVALAEVSAEVYACVKAHPTVPPPGTGSAGSAK